VVKRNRTHEPFDRRKLAASIAKAFEKRSTSPSHTGGYCGRDCPRAGNRWARSSFVGNRRESARKLRAIDEVAYLRYASVYQRFQDVDQFVDAIHTLGRRVKPNTLQRELFPPETAAGSTQGSRNMGQTRIMVAFKEEFPYLRTNSGQLFEFSRDWLHAAITRAADEAGYPSWWLTDHVTESIAFYLHLRNDENVVAFNQLSQTVRYVLKAIGYKEIVPHFAPSPRRFASRCWTSRITPGRL